MAANIMEKKLGEKFDAITYKKDMMGLITKMSSFMLKYFNILIVLFLPLYAFLAFLTYRKPYNYGEHLVINSYIQGLSFLATSIIFTISVFTDPSVYIITIILLIIYYTYAYGKLYQLSVAEAILRLFNFLAILVLASILLGIVSMACGYLLGRFI